MTNPVRNRTIKARALRKNQTKAEAIMWNSLRNRKLSGYKFRRQHVINEHIVDFFCKERLLIIEIDGPYHNEEIQKGLDKRRDQILIENGYYVRHFSNEQVFQNLSSVLSEIRSILQKNANSTNSKPTP